MYDDSYPMPRFDSSLSTLLDDSAALCYGAGLVIRRFSRAWQEIGSEGIDLPETPVAWIALAHHLGVRPIGLRHHSLTAVTLQHVRHGWLIVFNRSAKMNLQCRYLAHEITEYLLAACDPDCCPQVTCGRDCPDVKAWRHQVACLVTEMVLGK